MPTVLYFNFLTGGGGGSMSYGVHSTKKPSKTWHKPPLIGPLTPDQELRKREMQDELNKVAPHLVSFDTVRQFKNTEDSKVEDTLQRIRNNRSTYSPTEDIATSAAVQRLREMLR